MSSQNPLTKVQQQHIEKHVEKHVERQIDKKLPNKLLTKAEFFSSQFKQHVSTAIIAAFSFLIALAWKDLIVHGVESLINPAVIAKVPYISELISAFVVTIIAVIGIMVVTKWARKPEVLVSESRIKS